MSFYFSHPTQPTGSLFGNFPSFPMTTYGLTIAGITYGMPIPNVSGIPHWIGQIFAWFLGLIGAYFFYGVQLILMYIGNISLYVIYELQALFTTYISDIQTIGNGTGIFAPIIEIAMIGLLIPVVFGIFAIAQKITELVL